MISDFALSDWKLVAHFAGPALQHCTFAGHMPATSMHYGHCLHRELVFEEGDLNLAQHGSQKTCLGLPNKPSMLCAGCCNGGSGSANTD